MFSSASTSKVMVPSSHSRQQSIHSQLSEMGAEEGLDSTSMSNNQSGKSPRRKVNRSNPQLSYAYGAPSDGKRVLKKPRNSKEASVEVGLSMSPPPGPETNEKVDAASRYRAIKERQQQQQTSPTKKLASKVGHTDSPRRSARLSTTSSQDGVNPQERKKLIAAIEEDQAVEEEEEEEEEHASSSASQQRRKRLMSPGQSRSVNTHVSSFYLDANRSNDDDDGIEGKNGLPTSLLRGAQRPRHDPISPDLSGPGILSIGSSDLGDSHSRDYAEEERYARLLDQSNHQTSISAWSPKSWFTSKSAQNNSNGKEEEAAVGETSMEKKRRKARISDDNQLYRPETEEHFESDSGTSMEGRKHSHRKKKVDTKGGARGGRDDKKIWMSTSKRRGGKRRSIDGGEDITGDTSEEGEEEEEVEGDQEKIVKEGEKKDAESASQAKKLSNRRRDAANQAKVGSGVPLWAMVLGALMLFASLGLNFRVKSTDPLAYSSVSGLVTSLSAPKSLSEASERIVKLESAFQALKAAGSNAAKEEMRLAARLVHLETETDKANRQSISLQSAMQSHIKSTELESSRIKAEMGKLQTRLEAMHSESHTDSIALGNTLKKRLETLESQMKQTDKHLSEIAERAKLAERVAGEAKKSLEWLERKLPAEVAVPIQASSGKPTLDAATWQELKKLFMTKEDADFHGKNEKLIRALSLETIEGHIKTGVVLSRDNFLQLLNSELEQAKTSMEARFNANAGEIQNDILAKVRAQQDMFEKSGSWKRVQRGSLHDASEVNIPSIDGSEAKETIVTLIEAALERYSADRIARRDFALYSAGARVIPSLTSPTYRLESRPLLSWGNKRQENVKPPVIALHHETSPGMCWAFNGDDGQLGIGLSRKVIVSDVTLDHISPTISLEAGTSAPRDVTVWGLVERQEDRRRLAVHRLNQQEQQQQQQQQQQKHDDVGDYLEAPAPAPPSNNHLLLASFTYDIGSQRAIQTFPVSTEARLLQIPVSVVQVRVTSNHGNKDFTCLYRIRIHGQEWTGEDEERSR